MSDLVRVEYEKLSDVASRFSKQGEAANALLQMLMGKLSPLRAGSFKGEAADTFFQEMDDTLLPAVKRLQEIMAESSAVTNETARLFGQADEESSSRFKGYCQ